MSKIKKLLFASGASLGSLGLLIMPFGASAGVDSPLTRLSGPTRTGTAAAVSMEAYPAANSQDYIFIATKNDFADALYAGPLAAKKGAAILLTGKDSLDTETRDEIARSLLMDGDKDDIWIIGGEAVVSPAVVAEIEAIDPSIGTLRISGENRFKTAKALWEKLETINGVPKAAMIVNAYGWADALSGVPAAGDSSKKGVFPIMPTKTDELPDDVKAYLSASNGTLKDAYVLGGTSVVSDMVYTEVDNRIATTKRLAGSNRFGTNKAINDEFYTGATKIGVASGENFPDALSGGPFMAKNKGPMVLVKDDVVPSESAAYLVVNKATISSGWLFGGTKAVPDTIKAIVEGLYM